MKHSQWYILKVRGENNRISFTIEEAAEIAKKSLSTGISIRNLVLNEGLVSKDKIDTILNPLSMTTANAATV